MKSNPLSIALFLFRRKEKYLDYQVNNQKNF
jgi:hypothetical protein